MPKFYWIVGASPIAPLERAECLGLIPRHPVIQWLTSGFLVHTSQQQTCATGSVVAAPSAAPFGRVVLCTLPRQTWLVDAQVLAEGRTTLELTLRPAWCRRRDDL
jgi:hypothetical protein